MAKNPAEMLAESGMNYLRVRWFDPDSNEPDWIISELDADRWEIRKVEIFADGTKGYATRDVSVRGTMLSIEPLPQFHEIATDPQFLPEEITKQEFEMVWEARLANES